MTFNFSKFYFFLVIVLVQVSCKKRKTENATKPAKPTGELVIYLKQVVNNKEVSLATTLVKLYDNEVARTSNTYIIQQKTTDTSGTVHFYELEKETYYVHMSHPQKGIQLKTVSVPIRSIAYNTYVFQ
jgi:hypothetical protein